MADTENTPEVWLRGPIEGVTALLQPVAHALMQSNEEIHTLLRNFPEEMLWQQPAGVASVAFHLQHIPGVLDRLYSYSQGLTISQSQLKYLSEEGLEDPSVTVKSLLEKLDHSVADCIDHLKRIDPATLTDERTVGRKKLPSTVSGLLFHAAEHTMRHTGQVLVTATILMNEEYDGD